MDSRGVTVRRMRALHGPNVSAAIPVRVIAFDSGPYDERASDQVPGCVERLTAWLPGRAPHEVASVDATIPCTDAYGLSALNTLRGQAENKIRSLMHRRMPQGTSCTQAPDQQDALRTDWHRCQAGDRLVFIIDEVLPLVNALVESVTTTVLGSDQRGGWRVARLRRYKDMPC